jgi:hypothetical protein
MGWFFGTTSTDPDRKSFWQRLSTPAPRQLLVNHFGNLAKNGQIAIEKYSWSDNFDTNIPEDFACLRTEFVAEMNQLGYPKDARNIAVACGSTLGNALANQGFNAGNELFDMNLEANSFGRVTQIQMHASGPSTLNPLSFQNPYVMSRCNPNIGLQRLGMNVSPNNILFSAAIPTSFNQWLLVLGATPCDYNGVIIRQNNTIGANMDHVQGCKRRDFPSIKRLFSDIAAVQGVNFNLEDATYKRSFCFMPTMSTLDINWEMNQTNMERAFERSDVLSLSPFQAIYAPDRQFDNGKNLKHVEITSSMVTWLQGEMQIGETAGGATVVLPNANTQQIIFSTALLSLRIVLQKF